MSQEEVVKTLVEIKLSKPESFSIIAETLTRIGIKVRDGEINRLLQTCHILHKRGRYYITHFKELYALDGRETTFTAEDAARRNHIVRLLASWGLLEVISTGLAATPEPNDAGVQIIRHSDRANWVLTPKYAIGKPKGRYGHSHRNDT